MSDINYFNGYNHAYMKKLIPISSLRMFDGEDLSIFINISIWWSKNELISLTTLMDLIIVFRKIR